MCCLAGRVRWRVVHVWPLGQRRAMVSRRRRRNLARETVATLGCCRQAGELPRVLSTRMVCGVFSVVGAVFCGVLCFSIKMLRGTHVSGLTGRGFGGGGGYREKSHVEWYASGCASQKNRDRWLCACRRAFSKTRLTSEILVEARKYF